MRLFAKRCSIIVCLLAATSLLLFSCAEGAEVVSSMSNSSTESTSSEDAVLNQEASSDIQSEPSSTTSSVQETPSPSPSAAPAISSNAVKPASSKAEIPVASSKALSSSKTASSSKASSQAASSKVTSSKAASSKAASSKTTSSKATSSVPSSSGSSGYGPRISDDPSKSSGTSYYAAVEDEILTQLNSLRQSKGLNALKKSSALAAGARIRAKEMYDYNYFAHSRPDGGSWDSVFKVDIKLTNYSRLGENLVKMIGSAPDATAIMNLWINSPGHYANMVTPEYTHVGIGVFAGNVTGQGKTLYAVQEFGTFN